MKKMIARKTKKEGMDTYMLCRVTQVNSKSGETPHNLLQLPSREPIL